MAGLNRVFSEDEGALINFEEVDRLESLRACFPLPARSPPAPFGFRDDGQKEVSKGYRSRVFLKSSMQQQLLEGCNRLQMDMKQNH
jgi:hypothetical protein